MLVTDGGNGQNRAALSAVRALGRAGYEVHVTTSRWPSVAGWSRFCARRIPVPGVQDPTYTDAIRALQHRHGYAVVLPASDAALLALDWPGHVLVDKAEVTRRSAAAGFLALPQQVYARGSDLIASGSTLDYPVVVKPVARWATDDPTVWRADGPDDLRPAATASGPLVVQPYVADPMRAVSGVIWGGRLRAVVHQRYLRTWPSDCGVAAAAVTAPPDLVVEERLPRLLEGYDGIFQVQLLGEHVIDVNPRVYGSMSLSVRAGLNLPEIVYRLSTGEQVGAVAPVRGRVDTPYRWLEGDLKTLAAAVTDGDLSWRQALRQVPQPRDTAHGDVALSDPAPSAARLVHLVRGSVRRH